MLGFHAPQGCRPRGVALRPFNDVASNQVGLPAELKHISKRRKRN
jgi:hypothetical protein